MTTAIEFDFAKKDCRQIPVVDALPSCQRGLSCWIDVDQTDIPTARAVLERLGVNSRVIDQALSPWREGRHDVYDDCLHFAVSAVRLLGQSIETDHVHVILSPKFLVTVHAGPIDFIEKIRGVYVNDFQKFARTLSFLVFEIFDYLIDNYREEIRGLELRVKEFHGRIFAKVDDEIFSSVGSTTRDLLAFRSILLSSRDVAHELATRRSSFVAESSQPFMSNMENSLERLSADLAILREVLAEVLNLHMGIVSHRTNRVVNRLTVLSMIFLPLTFLCGVYGMNFHTFPELDWPYAYLTFWAVALAIALGLIVFMRRQRWI